MSDLMLFGILRMPYELAMGDELSRLQYWQRGQQAANEIERLREALHTIFCNTEPDAIKHRDYDHLAKNICEVARAALEGKE